MDSTTNEQITREEVWKARSAPNAFPQALLERARNAAAFFSAAFHGRNDVIYLADAGIRDIVLIDLMDDHLEQMTRIFPEVTATYADDAFAVARRLHEQGRQFDVVVTDPWVKMSYEVWTEHFTTFAPLVKRTWIAGLSLADLEQAGIQGSVEGVQAWLDADEQRQAFKAVWLGVRNSENGAIWIGLQRKQKPTFWDRLLRRG